MFRWLKRFSPATATPLDPSAELEAIRQYRVTRKLGEGGMGVVYEARDERLDRLVAIKRLRGLDADPSLKERLSREARVAAGISHPNICQVYELAEEHGELFVVMELLAGETLADRIGRGALPLGEALQTTLGVLGALEAMHSRGIIHRDLKPSNVFLTPHGVKLLDFGLARPETGDIQLTLTRPAPSWELPGTWRPKCSATSRSGPPPICSRWARSCSRCSPASPRSAGATLVEVYAALHEGRSLHRWSAGRMCMAVDRIIQRALAKEPARPLSRRGRDGAGNSSGAHPARQRAGYPGANHDPAHRAPVPPAAARCRDRVPCLQPARRRSPRRSPGWRR